MKTSYHIFWFAALALLLSACAKETYTLYPAADKVAGIQGSWKLASIQMKDDVTLGIDPVDVGALILGANPMTLSFAGSNFTLSKGDSYNPFQLESGTWSFDDPLYPAAISFAQSATTVVTQLSTPTRPQDTLLVLSIKGGCAGVASKYSYIYTFNRSK